MIVVRVWFDEIQTKRKEVCYFMVYGLHDGSIWRHLQYCTSWMIVIVLLYKMITELRVFLRKSSTSHLTNFLIEKKRVLIWNLINEIFLTLHRFLHTLTSDDPFYFMNKKWDSYFSELVFKFLMKKISQWDEMSFRKLIFSKLKVVVGQSRESGLTMICQLYLWWITKSPYIIFADISSNAPSLRPDYFPWWAWFMSVVFHQ